MICSICGVLVFRRRIHSRYHNDQILTLATVNTLVQLANKQKFGAKVRELVESMEKETQDA